MSNLLMRLEVPANVRKNRHVCPTALNIFEDRVESEGGQNRIWFFRDYIGMDIYLANFACEYASVRFLTSVNSGYLSSDGNRQGDRCQIIFCSGSFTLKPANEFTKYVYSVIKQAFDYFKVNSAPVAVPAAPVSPAYAPSAMDEIKKLKELLDMGAITQEEYDAKKKQLLGL